MNNKEKVDQLIDETLNSVDNIQRAAPAPFLFTRTHARLNRVKDISWERLFRFIGRPAFAFPALAMLILTNITVIVFHYSERTPSIAESLQSTPDDFSYAVAHIYDIDNTEP